MYTNGYSCVSIKLRKNKCWVEFGHSLLTPALGLESINQHSSKSWKLHISLQVMGLIFSEGCLVLWKNFMRHILNHT